jgi:hypothetical protein
VPGFGQDSGMAFRHIVSPGAFDSNVVEQHASPFI